MYVLSSLVTELKQFLLNLHQVVLFFFFFTQSSYFMSTSVRSSSGGVVLYSKDNHAKTLYTKALNIFVMCGLGEVTHINDVLLL